MISVPSVIDSADIHPSVSYLSIHPIASVGRELMRKVSTRVFVSLILLCLLTGVLVPDLSMAKSDTMVLETSDEWHTDDDTGAFSVHTSDVDNDGRVEIFTGGAAYSSTLPRGQLRAWRRDYCALDLLDSEVWLSPGPTGGATQVASVFVADIDGGGNEIITAGYTTVGGAIHGQLKAFTFSNDQLTAKGSSAEWKPTGEDGAYFYSVYAADVDGDSDIDIVTAGSIKSGSAWKAHVGVWHWDSQTSTFVLDDETSWQNANKDTEVRSVAIDDVNGDRTVDIVVAGHTGSQSHSYREGELRVYKYAMSASGKILTLQTSITWRGYHNMDTNATGVYIYDLDDDNDLDIVTVGGQYNYVDGKEEADVTIFDWDATLQRTAEKHWYTTGNTYLRGVSALDIDDDSNIEIVTVGLAVKVSTVEAQIGVFYWGGGSTITEDTKHEWYTDGGTHALSVDLRNVDVDSQIEIVTAGDHTISGPTKEAQLRMWNWDAPMIDSWTNKNPTVKPPARQEGELAYHEEEEVSVLFGGLGSSGHLDDTWVYELATNTWTNKNPSTHPSARQELAMVYDCVNKKILLFGGWDGTNYLDDTWTYDLTANTWAQKSLTTKPPARRAHAMVSDCVNKVAILFGGVDSSGTFSDTWAYNFNSGEWTNKNPSGSKPSARHDHKMAFDSAHGVVVLFGGMGAPSSDTWTYDYSANTWTNKNPSGTKPSARYEHNMVYDNANCVVILFGGDEDGQTYTFKSDTWVYDLDTNSWSQMNPSSHPSARRKHTMAFDSNSAAVVLFGGQTSGSSFNQDTWVYQYA